MKAENSSRILSTIRPCRPRSGPWCPLALALALAGASCESVPTYDEPGGLVVYDAGTGGAPDGGIRPSQPVMTGEIAPVYGFISSKERVEYYYMGEVTAKGGKVLVNEMYLFYDQDGKPLFRISEDGTRLVGWHPVVDLVPTKDGYSPFWRVVRVTVKGQADHAAIDALRKLPANKDTCQMDATCPEGKRCIEERCVDPIEVGIFELDAIKSLSSLSANLLPRQATSLVVNCPVVDADAKLLKGLSNSDMPLPKVQLWYKRLKAFCYMLDGGKDLFGDGAPGLLGGSLPKTPQKAYFIRQELTFGTKTKTPVLPLYNLVLTSFLPGQSGYSPLVSEHTVLVDDEHEYKDLTSVAEITTDGLKVRDEKRLHDLSVRGTIPACKSDKDCTKTGGKVDPPLKCSIETGYCSPPFARLWEECRRGVKECDPKGGPAGGRLACVGLRVREKNFCMHACDSSKTDENPDKDIDTRCGSIKGFRCYALRQTDPSRPNGVCIWICNSGAGNTEALLQECVSPSCGNGVLEQGETCDDANKVNKDGCNKYCTLSTFDRCDQSSECKAAGQSCKMPDKATKTNTYCLPVTKAEKDEDEDKGKYRPICMEYDYCWPPDERADWLGKKEETK